MQDKKKADAIELIKKLNLNLAQQRELANLIEELELKVKSITKTENESV